MGDLERLSGEQAVLGLVVMDLDLDLTAGERDLEAEAGEPARQARGEAERPVVIAQPAEAGHGGDPGTRQRGQVDAVLGVVVYVPEVHQRGLGEVVMGELDVAHLGGDHRLDEG